MIQSQDSSQNDLCDSFLTSYAKFLARKWVKNTSRSKLPMLQVFSWCTPSSTQQQTITATYYAANVYVL